MILKNSFLIRCLAYGCLLVVVLLLGLMGPWMDTMPRVFRVGKMSADRFHRLNQQALPNAFPPHVSQSALTVTSATGPPSRLLCHSFEGRLGNEMFQVASILGLAWTMNRLPVFVGHFSLNGLVKRSLRWPNQEELEAACRLAPWVYEDNCYTYTADLARLNPSLDYCLGTYLQSWKYFENHTARVIEALTFSDAIATEAAAITDVIRRQHGKAVLVGVHVRRGDFEVQELRRLGYPMASASFLNSSMTYFKRLFPDCVFVVSSENQGWCKQNVPAGFEVEFLDMHLPAVDMSVMISMDHVITTFGSYSWWIGYLNKGITVYMKDFIVSGTRIGNLFTSPEDYVYPGWVPI